jgi:hypothetical protein
MLVILSAAFAFEATSDLVLGSVPQTSVSLRQAEGPMYNGTSYHFSRLTAELAPGTQRHFEPGLKVRGSVYGLNVPSEQSGHFSFGNPTVELWLTGRPNDNSQVSLIVGGSTVALGDASAFHVLPYETATSGPLLGFHASGQAGALELQQTVLAQQGFFLSPLFVMSQTSVGGALRDDLHLLGTGTWTNFGSRLGMTARWQPRPAIDVGLGLDVPIEALFADDTVPLDVILEVRLERPREDGISRRKAPRQMREDLQDWVQGR